MEHWIFPLTVVGGITPIVKHDRVASVFEIDASHKFIRPIKMFA
jgi:hypothetical protein